MQKRTTNKNFEWEKKVSNFDPKELGEELPSLPQKVPADDEEYQMQVDPRPEPASRIDRDQLAAFRRVSLTLGKKPNSARQHWPSPGEDEEMKNQQDEHMERVTTEDSQKPDFGHNLQDLVTESPEEEENV